VRSVAPSRLPTADEDLVRLYLADVGRYPLLTKSDEARLAQVIEVAREATGRDRSH
jgi:hypothetical protein